MTTIINSFKTFKPHTPGIRTRRSIDNRKLLLKKKKPLKNLTSGYFFGNGRNHSGQITSWHRGGGHKRLYRNIDIYGEKMGLGIVEGNEYDPNRSSLIIRVFNPENHNHFYLLGIKDLKTGYVLHNNSIKNGNRLYLKDLPSGFVFHNLTSYNKKKAQYLRAAGTYGQLISKTSYYARIKLRSGIHRYFPLNASARLGSVINEDYKFNKLGKAGRNRWYGIRPHVRGVAINPVDHPHGGGEGRTSGGRPSVTPWGKPTKGQPSRNKHFNYYNVLLRKKKK